MTEEKEQTTPEQESGHIKQEQSEAAQPAAIEEQTPADKSESDMQPSESVPEKSETSQTLLLDKPEEPPLLDKPEEPPLLEAQTQLTDEKSEPDDKQADAAKQVQASQKKAKTDRGKPKKKKRHKDAAQYDQMVSCFAACGRCSYFLAGYRVIHGVENLETAVTNAKAGWLNLSWNHDMHKLLTKSYGIELYADIYHYDGCCPECGRHYTFRAGKHQGKGSLRVKISNRRR